MQTRNYLGKWELGCLVFHLCIVKLLQLQSHHPAGAPLWLSALVSGIVFLAFLFLALRFLPSRLASQPLVSGITVVYWLIAAVYAIKTGTDALHQITYSRSPDWFLTLFLLLGAAVPPLCGARSVYRMHSLLVLPIAVFLIVIALFGLQHARLAHLSPWFGNGIQSLLPAGFFSLLTYLDIPFLLILLPHARPEVKVSKTVFFSAAAGVGFYLAFALIISLCPAPQFLSPLYAMAKTGVSTEALYLLLFLISLMLYLGLSLHMIVLGLGNLKSRFHKRHVAALFALLLCLPLSGCYDSREVEETAYLIGLGIDKKEDTLRYTFQISNPLETGTTSGKEEESPPPEQSEDTNKGVNNMTIEAPNFYLALSQLRSFLGKEPDISHLKVIAFSKELAREGLTPHAQHLLSHQEIRPDTNLCLAESAEEFLTKVKPTLEQSTARYYELMFWRRYSPYAPVTELDDFVMNANDSGKDPVLPIAEKEQVAGMGIFRDGVLVAEANSRKAMLYKMLTGKASDITITAGDSVFSVDSRGTPDISVDVTQNPPAVTVTPILRARLLTGSTQDRSLLGAELEEEMTALLRECAALSSDILGFGTIARTSCRTNKEWQDINWRSVLKKSSIFTKSRINLEK